jgi:hypothetical protein
MTERCILCPHPSYINVLFVSREVTGPFPLCSFCARKWFNTSSKGKHKLLPRIRMAMSARAK